MWVLLLAALTCLLSADADPLQVSGSFNTIYLASSDLKEIEENGNLGMILRDIKFSKNYIKMTMTYYIRKHGKCDLHKFKATCKNILSFLIGKACIPKKPQDFVSRVWYLPDPQRYFPNVLTYKVSSGYTLKTPSDFSFKITYVSNTTILFFMTYTQQDQRKIRLTAALSKGTNLTEEIMGEYVALTKMLQIPIAHIKNMYQTDTCPK